MLMSWRLSYRFARLTKRESQPGSFTSTRNCPVHGGSTRTTQRAVFAFCRLLIPRPSWQPTVWPRLEPSLQSWKHPNAPRRGQEGYAAHLFGYLKDKRVVLCSPPVLSLLTLSAKLLEC